jgi:hypothetical protein
MRRNIKAVCAVAVFALIGGCQATLAHQFQVSAGPAGGVPDEAVVRQVLAAAAHECQVEQRPPQPRYADSFVEYLSPRGDVQLVARQTHALVVVDLWVWNGGTDSGDTGRFDDLTRTLREKLRQAFGARAWEATDKQLLPLVERGLAATPADTH